MFSLNTNCKVIIYGAATSGKIIYDILRKRKIEVTAFIDKRADEIDEMDGIRIVESIDEISDIDKENCIVVVAIKNVFEHSKIANRLVRNGVNNILYKPYVVLTGAGDENERVISECYDYLLNNEIDKLSNIPKTKKVTSYVCDDAALIRENDEWVWSRVPVCLIYANETTDESSIWGNIPILSMFPHIGLFREFLCDQVNNGIADYVEFCCEAAKNLGTVKTTERWKQNVISNRLDVFCNMETAYELDYDFFLRNAPQAKWNEAGYFNLLGGKHRCTFLVAKGKQYIVLQIPKKDYNEWINYDRVLALNEELNQNINEYDKRGFIEHPYFYKYPLDGNIFICKMWMYICDFLSKYTYVDQQNFKFNNMTAFVSVKDMGYTARNLSRMGVKVYRKTDNIKLEKEIDELLGVKIERYLEAENIPEVDLAVVENEKYENTKFCFIVSDQMLKSKKNEDYKEMLMSGFMLSGEKYLYFSENILC